MRWRRWMAAGGLMWLSLAAGCNALRETEECKVDLDCPRGSVCSTEGNYCRTSGPIQIGYLAAFTGTQAPVTAERRVALDFGRWVVERDPSRKVLGRGLEFRTEDTLGAVGEVPVTARRILDHNIAAL